VDDSEPLPSTSSSNSAKAKEKDDLLSSIQTGAGLNDNFLEKLSDIVSEKISKKFNFGTINPNWRNYERATPTVSSGQTYIKPFVI